MSTLMKGHPGNMRCSAILQDVQSPFACYMRTNAIDTAEAC